MPSRTLEFRYLQVVTNAISGDRRTIGLVHWDGERVRFDYSTTPLAGLESSEDLEKAARGLADKLEPLLRQHHPIELFNRELSEVIPGSTKNGDSLVWSETHRGFATNAEAHFEQLYGALGLLEGTRTAATKVSSRAISEALDQLALEFDSVADYVKRSWEVQGHFTYRSPLSWVNGTWNHTVPLNLDVDSPSELERHVRDTLARVWTSFPEGEVPVVVAVMPVDSEGPIHRAAKEAEYVRKELSAKKARLAKCTASGATVASGPTIDTSPLREMIRADVAQHLPQVELGRSKS